MFFLGFISLNCEGDLLSKVSKKIIFQWGFSHDVHYDIPEGIEVAIDKQTAIKVKGIDKELVGKVCADIKFLKPVEPYKGKGITSSDQFVLRKEGKKK